MGQTRATGCSPVAFSLYSLTHGVKALLAAASPFLNLPPKAGSGNTPAVT